jgi:hypothetical protein
MISYVELLIIFACIWLVMIYNHAIVFDRLMVIIDELSW